MTRDPERMTNMVEKLVRVGVLTPEEGRTLAGDIFNREFRKIGDDWTKRPITLTLAGIQTGVEDLRAGARKGGLLDDARALVNLRDELALEQQWLADSRLKLARRYLDDREPERVAVPADELWPPSECHPSDSRPEGRSRPVSSLRSEAVVDRWFEDGAGDAR